MTPTLSRRTFILSALAASISLYVGGWWGVKVRNNDSTDTIAAIVYKHLGYLDLDEQGVRDFATDLNERLDGSTNRVLSWLGLFHPLYAHIDVFEMTPATDQFKRFEEGVVERYLLSSDFFLYDADADRTVQYLGYYDPHERPCANPLTEI